MGYNTRERRTLSNGRKTIVFPPGTTTRSVVEWGRAHGYTAREQQWELRNTQVYCLYRPFRQRIVHSLCDWLYCFGEKDLDTVRANWHRVQPQWHRLHQTNTNLIPIPGWIPPKFVDVPVRMSQLHTVFPDLEQDEIDNTAVEFVNNSITETMWTALEQDQHYRPEVIAIDTWENGELVRR